MKWDHFIRLMGELPLFDLPTAVLLSGEARTQVTVQLSRWARAGCIIPLRRGLYALSDPYRRVRLSPLQVANEVYRPSYLSCLWALSFFGLVPDAVSTYQSVTTRVTRRFDNALGTFAYASLKRDLFWGTATRQIDGVSVSIAEPEKALLDLFHLTSGEWTLDRLREMRFQQLDLIDRERLVNFADRWESPRLQRAASRWLRLVEDDTIVRSS